MPELAEATPAMVYLTMEEVYRLLQAIDWQGSRSAICVETI
ncbi:MAG: hypothetical protein U9R79_00525 [Armatimonadota bacterium]|nr:hypothetical protein [Armatimonadota bacterium]